MWMLIGAGVEGNTLTHLEEKSFLESLVHYLVGQGDLLNEIPLNQSGHISSNVLGWPLIN